jgi:hypothetical protein
MSIEGTRMKTTTPFQGAAHDVPGANRREPCSKQRFTLQLPSDLVERLRDAVYWTPGLTLAGLAERALQEAVGGMEDQRGQPFPERTGELRAGRPVKAGRIDSARHECANVPKRAEPWP